LDLLGKDADHSSRLYAYLNERWTRPDFRAATVAQSSDLAGCRGQPSVVKASWALTSGGQVVAQGSTDKNKAGEWGDETIERNLGWFTGRNGRRYTLDLDILEDGTALAPCNPRLKVEVTAPFYEDALVASAAFSLVALGLALIGNFAFDFVHQGAARSALYDRSAAARWRSTLTCYDRS